MKRSRAKTTPYGDLTIREDKPMRSPLIQSGLIIDQTCMTSVCGWSMGVTQARKFPNYTPQKNLGAKIKVLRFHWMRV